MKTSVIVLGVGCAATMAILLSTDNGIPGTNLFRSSGNIETESGYDEQVEELLTPLPDNASGLNRVLSRLHTTSVQAFESIPAPVFGSDRMWSYSLLNDGTPPKHQPLLSVLNNPGNGRKIIRPQSELQADEAWLWLQLMYGVTDSGFVYRSRDLEPDVISKSLKMGWTPDGRKAGWGRVVDSSISQNERERTPHLVVGYPVISHIKEDRLRTQKYDVHLPSSTPMASSDRIWRVQQMELVSLLKHDPPVAYKDQGPVSMSSFTKFTEKARSTRSLNEMEVASLEALTEGKDRVFAWNASEERLQLLGAIRAKDQCLKCHEVKRGDLLGAFTYWIEEEQQTPNEATTSQDEAQRPR